MRNAIFKLTFVFSLSGSAAHALIGGRDVETNDPILRSFVGLAIQRDARGAVNQCSGVLISDRHVLTAGHCLASAHRGTPRAVTAYFFGSARQISDERVAAKLTIHPSFKPGRAGADLGLVTLERPVPHGFLPIQFANRGAEPGAPVEVAGVGLADFKNTSDEWNLKRGQLTYDRALGPESWLKRGRGGVPCLGDSGGPAFVYEGTGGPARLVGIQVDYTFERRSKSMTGAVIVHPTHYADWLKAIVDEDRE